MEGLFSVSRRLRATCQTAHQFLLPFRLASLDSADRDAKPRITTPHRMLRRMERVHLKQAFLQRRSEMLNSKGSGPVTIACKRAQFNHRLGQVYRSLRPEDLASKGWKHPKSKGDYFTLNAVQSNPSFDDVVLSTATLSRSRDPQRSVQEAAFHSFGLHKQLVDGLKELNIIKPTNIQLRTIPLLLSGKNVMCTAETGSGKTLAYLLPMLDVLHRHNAMYGPCPLPNKPFGLVLVPSRELAQQIHSVLIDLARYTPLRVDVKWGGNRTQRLLRKAPLSLVDVLVSTPGVLSKLLSNKMYDLSRLSFIVADEADSLLDDSFSPLTLRIINKLKVTSEMPVSAPAGSDQSQIGSTQIAFVGATLPRSVTEILGEIVPIDTIETVATNHVHRLMPHVAQKFLRLGPSEKPARLLAQLKSSGERRAPTIVFCNNSSTACFLGYLLESSGVGHVLLHSRMPHSVREGRYDQFCSGQTDVLVCTDIASRGLDTTRARHVVNYEFPHHMSDYVHRVGRVGRVGSEGSGHVLNFITYKWDVDLLWRIEMAQRKRTELHNVNANIKRKLVHRLDVPGQGASTA